MTGFEDNARPRGRHEAQTGAVESQSRSFDMLRLAALLSLVVGTASAQTAEGGAASAQGRFIRAMTALVLE
ncbi:hypothetical protein, partial [Rubrivirga sp.]|uniref:hypothetical protein n=1 Tax=Rubrivirga sp. TaxID=1885344 RepID=UPI003C7156E1